MRYSYEYWRLTKLLFDNGRVPIQTLEQIRLQYEQFRSQRFAALGQVLESERQLRGLLGLKIEDGFLVTHTPIKILEPPKLASMKVSWDSGNWTINLQCEVILDPIYKPCWFIFGNWNGYTVRAGDRDGRSFLMLVPRSYEQAIILRDVLIRLHKLSPQQVVTEDKEAEKPLD